MTEQDLHKIFKHGESANVEFKLSFNKAAIETLVAFANTKGGSVVIGVKDNGGIVGTNLNEESVQNWVNEIKTKTEPSIMPDVEQIMVDNNNIVVFSIKEYPIKPIAFQGRCFKRTRNSNHLMSASDVADMYLFATQYSWDSYPYQSAIFTDLNFLKVEEFINKVNDAGRFKLEKEPEKALRKLRLIKNKIPTNAAMIMFSKENLWYNVHIGRFKSSTHIIADTMINGNLYDVIERSMQVIISHIKFAFEITGSKTQRNEIPEYPLAAIRELLLNALVHRDYTNPSDIIIHPVRYCIE